MVVSDNGTELTSNAILRWQAGPRRKGTVLQSAMAMLNFYLSRAGHGLDPGRRRILEAAKVEVHALCRK